jgi:hypothetical protein
MNRFAFLSLLLSFTPYVFGSDEEEEKNYKKYWIAHGVCASIAWAILVPLAIGSSMLRKELVKAGFSEGFWFQLHRGLNLLAALLTIISFAISVHVVREEDGEAHLKEKSHFSVGTVLFFAAILQVTFALLRPPLPHKEEKKDSVKNMDEEDSVTETKDVENKVESTDNKSKPTAAMDESTDKESKETAAVGKKSLLRLGWEVNHRIFGVGLLGLAWWQIQVGWELFSEEDNDNGGKDLGWVFLGVAFGISGIVVIVKIVNRLRAHHA